MYVFFIIYFSDLFASIVKRGAEGNKKIDMDWI